MQNVNSLLNKLYPKYQTSIQLDKFLAHLENRRFWFLNNQDRFEENERYVFIGILDTKFDETVFVDRFLMSDNNNDLASRLLDDNSINKFSGWLDRVDDKTRYVVDICILPIKEKKAIALINQMFCSIQDNFNKELKTNQFAILFDQLEEKISAQNIGKVFILMFSMLLIAIIVRLLIYGFPLSAITVESLIVVSQEMFLSIGNLFLFTALIPSLVVVIGLQIYEIYKYNPIVNCKKQLLQSIKMMSVAVSLTFFLILLGTTIMSSINFWRVSLNIVEKPILQNLIVDLIADSYIRESSLPSIQEVKLNDSNQSEIILMMGIRDNVVYYYPQDLIRKIIKVELNNTDHNVCTDELYPSNTIKLLKTGKLRHKKTQRVALKNTQLISEYHSFKKSFCDTNTSK